MNSRVLLVDDEPNVLRGYERVLRRHFEIDTAESGAAALERVEEEQNYAVIVSDMRMPGMNGLELLQRMKVRAPDTVRVMVTGNADLQTAVSAINEGDVFRFLIKPCDLETLCNVLGDSVNQYRLIHAERELLEGTLTGAVRALSETLALVNPEAFGRVDRISQTMHDVASAAGCNIAWEIQVVAALSQIGCVILPSGTLNKLAAGCALTEEEHQLYDMHPNIASNLISKIPRLDEVAEAIRYQHKHFDGNGLPRDRVAGGQIPLGARLLKIVVDYDNSVSGGLEPAAALKVLQHQAAQYDPGLLQALSACVACHVGDGGKSVQIQLLTPGMVVAHDVYTKLGILLLKKGQRISESGREKLLNYLANDLIEEGILVSSEQENPHH